MTSRSSKALPFLSLILAFGFVAIEIHFNYKIPWEYVTPLITSVGIGGIPLKILTKAIETAKEINVAKFKQKSE